MMSIILITGYANSGKDTVGSILKTNGYSRYAFADFLKIHTADKHGFPLELTQTQMGKNTLVTSKDQQQTVRKFLIDESLLLKSLFNDEAFWAKLLEKTIKEDKVNRVVITDWRYHSEINHFKQEFANWKISTIRIRRNSVQSLDDPSEHNLDDFVCDYTIDNNGTVDELKAQLLLLPILD